MLTHQPSPSKLIAPCSHHPSPPTQRSPYPPLQFRIRFTNSQRLFLHRESRISLAMHVGTPSFLCPPPFPGFITHRLDRQRKVKCNQLPGQLKVRRSPPFPLHMLDQLFLSFPSAKYAIPLRSALHQLTHPPMLSIVWSKIIHARTFSASLWSLRRRVNVSLFRHHAQQATSEKKRISTVSRRPRAYTSNTQQRSVYPLSLLPSPA
jgi:hypothetical protein